MNTEDIIKELSDLVQLDIDAFHAYSQALKNIYHQAISDQIKSFQADHMEHVNNLSREITRMGGQPPEFSQDFKGYLIEGFTSLRSVTGTEGALKAMKTNETLTNKTYESAVKKEFTPEIKTILEKNYDDEKRHLKYIEDAINTEAWNK